MEIWYDKSATDQEIKECCGDYIGYFYTNYDEYVTHWQPLPELPSTPKERGANE